MNLDLVVANNNEIGIISDTPFKKEIEAIQLDQESKMITIGFAGGKDVQLLNVPIGDPMTPYILENDRCHVAVLNNGHITDARQVPVFITNPVPETFAHFHTGPHIASVSLVAMSFFIQKPESGQPLHRDDLGDEQSLHKISHQMALPSLQLAPHLVKALQNEKSLAMAQKLQPQAPAPQAPGLGLSSVTPKPPRTNKGDKTIH